MSYARMVVALLALLSVAPTEAQTASRTLYSSGSVASGAIVDTGILKLQKSNVSHLEIVVDNKAGTALRDLVMWTYADDGVTVISSTAVRKVAYGTAPTGSRYAPGDVRGYIGPNPPGGTTGVHVLSDVTSATNTANDVTLYTEDCDTLFVAANPSGSVAQLTPYQIDDDGTSAGTWSIVTPPAAAAAQYVSWGSGSSALAGGSNANLMQISVPVPRRARFTTSAVSGQTVRMRVLCRGRIPGTLAHQTVLPTFARFTLDAGGSGAASMTVLGL